MSSKVALKQLQSLQESRERPDGDKEIKKAIRKKKRSNKKQVQARQQLQAAKDSSSKLEYYKSTTSAQKATAEIMSKVSAHTPHMLLLCCDVSAIQPYPCRC